MIKALSLLRNIGQFDSVSSGDQLQLKRLTLVYAENGRGKTTLSAILRSLQTGVAERIEERRRFGSAHPPHVVIDLNSPPSPAIYQNGAWSRAAPELLIFDDVFVDENVFSGLTVESSHRQNLNEVILGAQGVSLNRDLQQIVERIEAHNRELRALSDVIPTELRGALSVDEFCALPLQPDVDEALIESRRLLSAVVEADLINRTPPLSPIVLPALDAAAIQAICERTLEGISSAAASAVENQIRNLGPNSANWLADGVQRINESDASRHCPFCTQETIGIPIVDSYRAYFSEAYTEHKAQITSAVTNLERSHGVATKDRFAAASEALLERRLFWSRFSELPDVALDSAGILTAWTRVADAAIAYLRAKSQSPLERLALPIQLSSSLRNFEVRAAEVAAVNDSIAEANRLIAVVKERAAAGSATAIEADIRRLMIIKARHSEPAQTSCQNYSAEKAAKSQTESLRDQAKAALDTYRTSIFPAYETSINLYLQRLNADFRIDSVTSTTNRGGASCTYNVVVNQSRVAVGTAQPSGSPSFRSVLSAGDRNTLALAVFFASLDRDPTLADRAVVVDDPMTSLDEHRLLVTAQELRRLSQRAAQVIVMSHDKPFLFRVWDGADRSSRSALVLARSANGSVLRAWDVTADMVTEHDRRHASMKAYIDGNDGTARSVAEHLRPILEHYLRAAYPDVFGPGMLIGPFVDRARDALGSPQAFLDTADVSELQDLKEYANRFHHDTNVNSAAEVINDGELLGYAKRVFAFTRRS